MLATTSTTEKLKTVAETTQAVVQDKTTHSIKQDADTFTTGESTIGDIPLEMTLVVAVLLLLISVAAFFVYRKRRSEARYDYTNAVEDTVTSDESLSKVRHPEYV